MALGRRDTTPILRPLGIIAAAAAVALVLMNSAHPGRAHAATGLPFSVYMVDDSEPGIVTPVPTDTNTPASGITVGLLPTAIAITPDSSTAWVVNGDDGTIQSIDTRTNEAGTAIPPLGSRLTNPGPIAITPDGKVAFVGQGAAAVAVVLPSGPITPLAAPSSPVSPEAVAVTPDGGTLYVAGFSNGHTAAQRYSARPPSSPIGGPITLDADNGGVGGMAVSPDGSTVYVVTNPDAIIQPSHVVPILTSNGSAGTPIPVGDQADGIAITPDGKTAFVVNGVDRTLTPIALAAGGGTTKASISLPPVTPTAVAVTPDGNDVYVAAESFSGENTPPVSTLVVLSTKDLAGTPTVISQNLGTFADALAITPDQAPVASFSATAGVAGQPTAFNASASTVKYGSITDFAWDFGDGSLVVHAPTPTVSHTYTAAGTFTASLTETDSAGTSVTQVFTGQTMLRNGGPSAQRSVAVTVPPPTTTTNSTTSTTSPTTTGSTNPTTTSGTTSTTTPGTTATTPTTGTTSSTTAIAQPGTGGPTLAVSPTLGPPGQVVEATGSGFPANTTIALAWQPGIGSFQTTTDGLGGLHTFVLVYPHDELGTTQLVAESWPPASAAFLVVQSPGEPGGRGALVLYRR